MTEIAVVILNYNGEKLLPQFLPSVVRHSGEALICVADNGSTDHSINFLRREFPQVKIIELGGNFGFCGGYNKALTQVEARYFVLLNSDVEVTADWLAPLRHLLETDVEIAAVQPKILSYQHRDLFEYAGAGGGFIDTLGYPFCRGRIFDHVEKDAGQYNDTIPVFWSSGACMMIRAEKFIEHGGFDEDFFAHMEEIDLCWKLNRAGSKVYYCGESRVYHLGAGTLGYHNPRKTYLNFRNGLGLITKHLDSGELFYKLPLRIALDWVAALFFLLRGEGRNFISVLRAHRDFALRFKTHIRKRKLIRSRYPAYPRKTIHRGLIIFDYYIRKRKTFPLQ
jgi:hypothetical protein